MHSTFTDKSFHNYICRTVVVKPEFSIHAPAGVALLCSGSSPWLLSSAEYWWKKVLCNFCFINDLLTFGQDGRLMVDKTQRILLDCDPHKLHTYQCGILNGSVALKSAIWSASIHGRYYIIAD